MAQINLSAPWVLLYRKIEAMFKEDSDIRVIFDDSDGDNKHIKIYVDNGCTLKAEAIETLLIPDIDFGNIHVDISVIPANLYQEAYRYVRTIAKRKVQDEAITNIFDCAFAGSPVLRYTKAIEGILTNPIYYVVFDKVVVQYFTDDIGDAHGVCSTLYQEIAKDIFKPFDNVYYCTDIQDAPLF